MADATVTMRFDPEQTRRIMDAAVARFRLDIEAIRRETWGEAVAALRDEAAARIADPTTGSTAWAVYSTAADYLETVAPGEKAPTAAHRAPQSDERGPGVQPGTPAPEET